MKPLPKALVAMVLLAVLGVVGFMVTITFLHAKSRRQITQLVSEIQPGMSYGSVTSRLGRVSEIFTNAAEIQSWGTTKEDRIVTNSTLHLFVHQAIPWRWICIYTDRDSQAVIHASWKDM